MGRYMPIKTKFKDVKNAHLQSYHWKNKKNINTVHNLITFYIVFTNKNVFFFNLFSETFLILNFQFFFVKKLIKKNLGGLNTS